MLHKKQAFNQIERTRIWNISRGNTPDTLNWELETDMLNEEVHEIASADSEANRFKELLDLMFVTLGSLSKMNIPPEGIVEGYEIVLVSNESKSATKNSAGKITKPEGFISPEPLLQLILNRR